MTDNIVPISTSHEAAGKAMMDLIRATHMGVQTYLETAKIEGASTDALVQEYHRHMEQEDESYKAALEHLRRLAPSKSDDVAGLATFFLMVNLALAALPKAMHAEGVTALMWSVLQSYDVPEEQQPHVIMAVMQRLDGVNVVQIGAENEVMH